MHSWLPRESRNFPSPGLSYLLICVLVTKAVRFFFSFLDFPSLLLKPVSYSQVYSKGKKKNLPVSQDSAVPSVCWDLK